MHESTYDKRAVHAHVAEVRRKIGHRSLRDKLERAGKVLGDEAGGHPARRLRAELDPNRILNQPSSGGEPDPTPYLSRNPIVSLTQSEIEKRLVDDGLDKPPDRHTWLDRLIARVRFVFRLDKQYRRGDPGWYLGIAAGVLDRIAEHNHSFNEQPAELEIADNSRILLVGDWGTGLPRAQDVAEQMRLVIQPAVDAGRQVHVVHLGDVYYSGLPSEDVHHFLNYWPVGNDLAEAGVTSWSLNGNHDMYSGGHGYFEELLGDKRFKKQASADGSTTSFFRLYSSSWEFLGLDTAYYFLYLWPGHSAKLHEPQADYVAGIAAQDEDKKLVLLSHHQLVSVYEQDDITDELRDKLAPVLDNNRVTAWWWGHEHRAVAYEPVSGVQFPRCLGNGGVPVLTDGPPPPGTPVQIEWRSSRSHNAHGRSWTKFGFAVLDLDGPKIEARYIDEDGVVAYSETIC